jgi:hypothetical protein
MKWNIILRGGLGELAFGTRPCEVAILMGEPSRVDDRLTEIADFVLRWEYHTPRISLIFSPDLREGGGSEKRLVLIGAADREVTLFGEPIWGEKIESVLSRLAGHELGQCSETEDAILGRQIDFADSKLRLTVSDGVISHIQWSISSAGRSSC